MTVASIGRKTSILRRINYNIEIELAKLALNYGAPRPKDVIDGFIRRIHVLNALLRKQL